jgi:hypothetical protein
MILYLGGCYAMEIIFCLRSCNGDQVHSLVSDFQMTAVTSLRLNIWIFDLPSNPKELPCVLILLLLHIMLHCTEISQQIHLDSIEGSKERLWSSCNVMK